MLQHTADLMLPFENSKIPVNRKIIPTVFDPIEAKINNVIPVINFKLSFLDSSLQIDTPFLATANYGMK